MNNKKQILAQPIKYHILLKPDLATFTFSGCCDIQLISEEPVSKVTLNAIDLEIETCTFAQNENKSACTFQPDNEKEELIIALPSPCKGEFTLSIFYTGAINDKLGGFYRSAYQAGNESRYIGVTQFEETDARKAIPCMDHPVHKAHFSVEMIIDKELNAISNEDVETEEALPDGKKRIRFRETPFMSTYLLFFGVGDFRKIRNRKDSRVRLSSVPGRIEYGDFGLDFGAKALAYCEQYYGIPYPLTKLDLIAVPDFAFGAMENWGAVTFRENLLLYYPGITSSHGKRRICEVVAHEIVHMWFGNLVTPSDWKYLWLNESFATFFGFGIVDHYFPDWEIWDQFILEETAIAMERDALSDTFAIELPGQDHVVINTSTAPIIYNKGGSLLRMMKEFIGEDLFRAGLTAYLSSHAYGNTTSIDFLKAFDDVCGTIDGVRIVELMNSWITHAGFPLVTVKKENDVLVFQQKRFSFLPIEKETDDASWIIPLVIEVYYEDNTSETLRFIFREKMRKIRLQKKAAYYKVNPEHTGFYHIYYDDEENRRLLGDSITLKKTTSKNTWGIENDFYASVKACITPFRDYLDFLSCYRSELSYLPLISISDHLFESCLILSDEWQPLINEKGKVLFEQALNAIGLDPKEDDAFTTRLLRGRILFDALFHGSNSASYYCLDRFDDLSKGKNIHPDILGSAAKGAARLVPEKAWGVLIDRFEKTKSEHERIIILSALSCFSRKEFIDDALAFAIEKVPARNKFMLIASMAGNPAALPFLWDWYVSHISTLSSYHPVHYERIMNAVIPSAGLGREEEVFAFFKDRIVQPDFMGSTLSIALERLRINMRMRKENRKQDSPG